MGTGVRRTCVRWGIPLPIGPGEDRRYRLYQKSHNQSVYYRVWYPIPVAQHRTREQERIKANRRRQTVRKDAIHALGGICESCGWSGPDVGFDVHHRHGGGEVHRSKMNYVAYYRGIAESPDEYQLLCATCHRVHHLNVP